MCSTAARSTSPPNCSRKPSAPTSASGKRFARSRLSVAERRRRGKRTRGSEMRRRILSRPSTPRCRTNSTLARRLRSYERLRDPVRSVEAERRRAPPKVKADPGLRAATKNSLAAFDAAMSDDFNTREAIAVLFEFARDVNKAIESGVGRGPLDGAAEAFRTFGDVLGLFQMKPSETDRLDGVLELIVGLRED